MSALLRAFSLLTGTFRGRDKGAEGAKPTPTVCCAALRNQAPTRSPPGVPGAGVKNRAALFGAQRGGKAGGAANQRF
jgi:hypothetical protein